MKKFLNLSLLAIIAGFIVVSCNKSSDENAAPSIEKKSPSFSFLQSPEGNAEITKMLTNYMEKNPQLKGSEFIVPFFTSDGFGLFKNVVIDCDIPEFPGWCFIVEGELAFFNAEYGPQDFWKVNPDGTISIHLNSQQASAVHFDIGTSTVSTGENCHLNMNYTGTWTEETVVFPDGEEITFYFIDLENSPSAVSWHGNGKVQVDGSGPKKNLVAKVVMTPGGPISTTVNLN